MTALSFAGMLPGLEAPITDPAEWTKKLVKDHHPPEPYYRGGKPVPVRMAATSTTQLYRRSLAVKLTQVEREWLGVSVRLVDRPGAVWQVWALHPERGRVWIVREGVHDDQPLTNLERVS